ncbi:beta-lactamase [Ktedonospora formicarum]|uniref:Beta-lactamase n=1 Tax=Ktedonospora formicarum TaxID=2778364 RepID=A0A8J3HV09_9CHLR|nr:beta-lactamase [Ktedonospora formicarum]
MNIRENIYALFMLLLACFVALSGGLMYWQVVVARQVAESTRNSRPCLTSNAPLRGRIFDRNGVLLAESKPTNRGCGYLRVYYEPSLANVIGMYISPLYNVTGIEKQYDDYLSGRVGSTGLSNTMNQLLHRAPMGNDIYLTIDVRIQRLVDQHFDDPVTIDNRDTFATNRGSVIVTDPHTGEILAMVSRPGYDPNQVIDGIFDGNMDYYNQLLKDQEHPLRERNLQETYIPGSVYKMVSLMAGLDSGNARLNDLYSKQQAIGPIIINGQAFGPTGNNISDFTKRFPVTTEYGFVHSDNIIFAQVGVKMGTDTWLDYNKRFYVGEKIPFDLPVTPSTTQLNEQTLEVNELASDAFGQGFNAMTPLQMSLFTNAVSNDGQLMRPMLLARTADRKGTVLQTFTPQAMGAQQISVQTAAQVRQAMYGVVQCGSGSVVPQLINSGMSIIAKTGTAQVSNDGSIPAHSWMVTAAPYSVNQPSQLPALTIIAMKENGGEGGSAVGPMIAAMYRDIFNNGYVKATLPAPISPTTYCCRTRLLQC